MNNIKVNLFVKKLESVQYKISDYRCHTRHFARNNTYQELGLESFKSKRWYKLISRIFKVTKKEAPI